MEASEASWGESNCLGLSIDVTTNRVSSQRLLGTTIGGDRAKTLMQRSLQVSTFAGLLWTVAATVLVPDCYLSLSERSKGNV